jgi:hypothetical protein
VPGYARIVYENAFPDIDVHFYSNSWALKVFFVVKPGGSPGAIQLLFTGQDSIGQIASNPALNMYLRGWSLQFPQAIAYQIDASNNTSIMPWLPTWDHYGGGVVGVQVGTYNPSERLVIAIGGVGQKPTDIGNLDWSVFYGDDGNQNSPRIHADDNGLYHAMGERGSVFAVTTGPHVNDINNGGFDWYVSKFINTEREWATYYGGSNHEFPTAINTFTNPGATVIGGVWVAGTTWSNNVPPGTVNPGGFLQTANAGLIQSTCNDGLIASFDDATGALRYSTYFGAGGVSEDIINDMVIDNDEARLYIVGNTEYQASFNGNCSSQTTGDFPLCPGIFGASHYFKGGKNSSVEKEGFIAKFDINKMTLMWSTLFGGEGGEEIQKVQVRNGELYVGGITWSANMNESPSPTTSHSIDEFPLSDPGGGAFFQNSNALPQSPRNLFISKFDTELQLVWSTLFGHSISGIRGIEFNSNDDLYILGLGMDPAMAAAPSPNPNPNGQVPVYDNGTSYYETPGGNNHRMVLARFDEANTLQWSTLLHSSPSGFTHSSPHSVSSGLAIDENDRIYVGTFMNLASAPVYNVTGAYWQAQNASASTTGTNMYDNYILGFSNAEQLAWGTFFGGAMSTAASSSVIHSYDNLMDLTTRDGYLYITGITSCPSSPYMECPFPNSYCDQSYNADQDCYISRFNTDLIPDPPLSVKGIRADNVQVKAYPNPSSDVFNISFVHKGSNLSQGVFKITDITGRVLRSADLKIKGGVNQFSLDFSNFPAGAYFVTVSGDAVNGTVKLIKK